MDIKISLVVCSMNRNDRAISSINSWFPFPLFDEIILVDWNSTPPISSIKDFLFIDKLKTLRIENQNYFNYGKAYNYGILSTKNDFILKIDVDHVLQRSSFVDFLEKCAEILNFNKFFTGRDESNPEFNHGFALFRKSDFIKAGMYNENLEGWGYDNTDLYDRMKSFLKEIPLELKHKIYHIPHGDDLRVENYLEKNKDWSFEKNKLTVTEYLKHLG